LCAHQRFGVPRCRASIPGIGPLVAITFKSAIDDPGRIAKSKIVGALFGLVPVQLREQFERGNVTSRPQEFAGGVVDFLLGRGTRHPR
jgi:transposase